MTYISKQKLIFKSFRECLETEMRKLVLKPLPTHPTPTHWNVDPLVKCNAISGIMAGAQQIETELS